MQNPIMRTLLLYQREIHYYRHEHHVSNAHYVKLHIDAPIELKKEAASTWVDINREDNLRRVERE